MSSLLLIRHTSIKLVIFNIIAHNDASMRVIFLSACPGPAVPRRKLLKPKGQRHLWHPVRLSTEPVCSAPAAARWRFSRAEVFPTLNNFKCPGIWNRASLAQCNYRALFTLPLEPWDRDSVRSTGAIPMAVWGLSPATCRHLCSSL